MSGKGVSEGRREPVQGHRGVADDNQNNEVPAYGAESRETSRG